MVLREMIEQKQEKRYNAIDGLRAIATFGIIMMHVEANTLYDINGWLYKTCILSFTNFVFLFMVISSFGMCCGYFQRILDNKISMTEFYVKRFGKIFPFFALLVLMDFIVAPSSDSLYEAFANLTLLFGFLPDCGNITVIGVAWYLGLTFVFYLIFPFYCTLLTSKKKAWIAFVISLAYNFVCAYYFKVGRNNILYSACFFMVGGLLYLYQEQIIKFNKWILFSLTIVTIIIYYAIRGNALGCLLVSTALVMYAMLPNIRLLDNRITKFFSNISMEMYLSHMVIFRIVQMLKLEYLFGKNWVGYIATVLLVLVGTTVFAVVTKHILIYINKFILTLKLHGEE